VRIRIEGSDLPGRRGGSEADALWRNNVHVGVQRRAEAVGLPLLVALIQPRS
jgi:hypothetical protein